jgi:hypothetical protein
MVVMADEYPFVDRFANRLVNAFANRIFLVMVTQPWRISVECQGIALPPSEPIEFGHAAKNGSETMNKPANARSP